MQFKQYFEEAVEPVTSLTENEEKFIDKLADIFYNKAQEEIKKGFSNNLNSFEFHRKLLDKAKELANEMLMEPVHTLEYVYSAYPFVDAFIGVDTDIKPKFGHELDQIIKPEFANSPSMYYDRGKVLSQIFYDYNKNEPRTLNKEIIKKVFEICLLNVLNSKEGRITRLKDNIWFAKYFKIRNVPKGSQEMFGGMVNAI